MVGFFPKSSSWLTSLLTLHNRGRRAADPPEPLGILSFEAARTMSRLCAIHRALSDPELHRLRSRTTRSPGVCLLVSHDQHRLLRLASAEMLLDLDSAAASVSRLALRCRGHSPWPRAFPHVYSDLKSSSFDSRLAFPPKEAAKHVQRMERYAAGAAALYAEMEALAEMEASERKLRRWRSHSGPLSGPPPPTTSQRGNDVDPFHKKLAAQRRIVRRLQKGSLWSVGVEKAADLMGRAVVTVYARLCSTFKAVVPELPVVDSDGRGRPRVHPRVHPNYLSGPLERKRAASVDGVGMSGPVVLRGGQGAAAEGWAAREMEAGEGTVGAAGLALRYADVVGAAERMLQWPEVVGEEARGELYAMLPGALRAAVAARSGEVDGGEEAAARGGEAARRVLGWLGPMAADTARWHSERSCEGQRGVEAAAPRVFALQTLQFADRRKMEAAIAEVLVGLSCVMRYLHDKRRREEEEYAASELFWENL